MSSVPQDPGRKRKAFDRRFARLHIAIPGTLEGRTEHKVEVLDLSLGGCLVRGLARPEPGSIVDVRFGLGAEAFKAKTRVREASVDGEVTEPVQLPRGPRVRALVGERPGPAAPVPGERRAAEAEWTSSL